MRALCAPRRVGAESAAALAGATSKGKAGDGGKAKGKPAAAAAAPAVPELRTKIQPVVEPQTIASPRLISAINPEGWTSTGTSFKAVYETSPLPSFAPRKLVVRTLCHGRHVMRDLPETASVADVAHELHTRLMLPPWRGIFLSHWGHELAPHKRLGESGLRTDSELDAIIRYVDPDRSAPLTRIRLVSPHLCTRHVPVHAGMLVRELKEDIEAYVRKGVHTWHAADGTAKRVEGATLLCKVTKPYDEKNLTTSMARAEEFVLEGLGGDKKDKYRVSRAASGQQAQIGLDDAVKLELPPKAQTLSYNGELMVDDAPLSAYRVLHNDALVLTFDNPALRATDAPVRGGAKGKAPPKPKKK